MSAPTRNKSALKGSARLITEFFEYSINSILYQRGIYPPEDFTTVRKYDLNMLVSTDSQVKDYIRSIMGQLSKWLAAGKISKLILAIVGKDTAEVLERWQFDIDLLDDCTDDPETSTSKPVSQIQSEIQAIIRQITASVTFLPVLQESCTFNVLVYASSSAKVPAEWGDSDGKDLSNPEQVQFRSFATDGYKVGAQVAYKHG